MWTIKSGKPNVLKLLGKQSIKSTEYRLMKYVLLSKCEEGILLHNSITGKLVLLDCNESLYLEKMYSDDGQIERQLIQDYFLVPFDFNEREFVLKIRKIMRSINPSQGINSYVILTTTNCNARCFYCYQSGITHVNMSSETAEKITDYILTHKADSTLHLKWFGGEPLVGMSRIDQICNALAERNVDFSSSMISNGYLFDEQIVWKAVHLWRLKRIQVTLDGTRDIYNKTKAYTNSDSDPYYRVLNNIKQLLENNIYVSIRLNLDSHNRDDLGNLVHDLKAHFGMFKNFGVYTHVLFENVGFSPLKRDPETEKDLYSSQDALRKKIEEYGFSNRQEALPALKTHACMADSESAVCFFPDGRMFKCEHTKEGDEFGHIEKGITDRSKIVKFQDTYETENCHDCPLYPKCILLKHCPGTESFLDERVCKYNIEVARQSMKHYYTQEDRRKNQ